MPLDFHVAKSEDEASQKYGGASFDETIHEQIFYRIGLPEGEFVYFRRMMDYYKDAKYMGAEVDGLRSEVKLLEKLFVTNERILKQLNEIKRMCHKAIDKKMSLWVYCD